MSIAEKFQSFSRQALKSPEELSSDEMKLRGLARKASDEFAQEIRKDGHYYRFFEIGETLDATSLKDHLSSASQGSVVSQSPLDMIWELYF